MQWVRHRERDYFQNLFRPPVSLCFGSAVSCLGDKAQQVEEDKKLAAPFRALLMAASGFGSKQHYSLDWFHPALQQAVQAAASFSGYFQPLYSRWSFFNHSLHIVAQSFHLLTTALLPIFWWEFWRHKWLLSQYQSHDPKDLNNQCMRAVDW